MIKSSGVSRETRLKMSIAHMGSKNHNFGKKISEKQKRQISIANSGSNNYLFGKTHTIETKKKMSLARLKNPIRYWFGKKLPKDIREKISTANSGKKRPDQIGRKNKAWKGGVTTENHKVRNSLESNQWRESVLARDMYTCKKCYDNKGGNLNAHHIQNFSTHPDLRLLKDNGITLCRGCHDRFHKIYGVKNNTIEQLNEYMSRD